MFHEAKLSISDEDSSLAFIVCTNQGREPVPVESCYS